MANSNLQSPQVLEIQEALWTKLTRVEVGEVILSFYSLGPDERSCKSVVEQCLQRLKGALVNAENFPQPLRGVYGPPIVEWSDWHLSAPGTGLSWAGAFHLILRAEELSQSQGCLWTVDEYKQFARHWIDRVLEAFRSSPDVAQSVLLDEKPFYWTLALDTEPSGIWTSDNLEAYRRSLTALVRVRSTDAPCTPSRLCRRFFKTT